MSQAELLTVRRLNVEPDVLRLGRRLFQAALPSLLWSSDGSGPSYLAAEPCELSHALDPEPLLPLRAAPVTALNGIWAAVPRWIGVLPYEAERARLERGASVSHDTRPPAMIAQPTWLRYPAVAVVDHHVTVVGEDPRAVQRLCELLQAPEPAQREFVLRGPGIAESEARQLSNIQQALDWIAQGEVYQVNLAHCLSFELQGSNLELLSRLGALARNAFSGAVELPDGSAFVSTSPELFLKTTAGGRVLTLPIKGTRLRGQDAVTAKLAREELDASPKERAELAMVVDVERNDLNRVCETGTVVAEPPRVFASSRVYHRQASVSGVLRPDVSRTALLQAMLPSGSVTGAPKIRAMELIALVESGRRGAYTGAVGALNHDGSLVLGMNIRCASRRGCDLEYWVGGGLVLESDPRAEIEERRWKALQMLHACRS